jgi:DedD protein
MAEEEFHEIQLNGKQLVFLFMAGTVAAVVIFLCGLMVGRNLRVPSLEAAASTTEEIVSDPTRATDPDLPPAPASTSDGSPPPTTKEDLTYSSLVDAPNPPDEQLPSVKTPAEKVSPPVAKAALPAKPVPEKPLAFAEPAGNGWTVQVQAVNSRDEADGIARRLNAKGYPAFVTPRGSGTLTRYGIRIGKYQKKQEAEAMKTRLERQEQYKPWVTR